MLSLIFFALHFLQGLALPPPKGTETSPISNHTACTWTTFVEASFTSGPTSTAFTTSTHTIRLFDCHGCYHVSTVPIGHDFWKVSYNATVTVTSPYTITNAVCSATPVRPGCVGASCLPAVTSTCSDEATPTSQVRHTPHPIPEVTRSATPIPTTLWDFPIPTMPGPVVPGSFTGTVVSDNPSATFTTV